MNHHPEPTNLESQIEEISESILSLAAGHEGHTKELLLILRSLEQLHRDIRQQWFEPSLPKTRQDLYHLLREIEEKGGWPYIERMKIKMILRYLLAEQANSQKGEKDG